MNCKAYRKQIIFYVEGDLPPQEMEVMKSHLAECTDCAAFAEEVKKTLGVVEAEKFPEVNPFFYTRLKARMETQAMEHARKERNPVMIRILQPAMFTILLLAGIYAGIKIGQPSGGELSASSYPQEQMIPYLNEMETEPIEGFLME